MGLVLKEDNRAAVKEVLRKRIDTRMMALGSAGVTDLKIALSAHGNVTGGDPSAPGEDPAKVTGRLVSSMTYTYDAATKKLRIGTTVLYGKFLELGTRFMAARPFLRNFVRRNLAKIKAIVLGHE